MLTTAEAAGRLGLLPRSVSALCRRGLLTGRPATLEEIAALILAGRIRTVPPTGVTLYDEAEIVRYAGERRPAHRPKIEG